MGQGAASRVDKMLFGILAQKSFQDEDSASYFWGIYLILNAETPTYFLQLLLFLLCISKLLEGYVFNLIWQFIGNNFEFMPNYLSA